MFYATCINCAADKANCARRAEIRAAIKGTGITSAKFSCTDRRSIFQPGQRVSVTWPAYESVEDYYDESWPATVIVESGNRFVIQVDDVPGTYETPARDYIKNQNLFAKASAARLRAIDEPARAICGFCGGAPGDGPCPEIGRGWDGSPPNCVLAKVSAE